MKTRAFSSKLKLNIIFLCKLVNGLGQEAKQWKNNDKLGNYLFKEILEVVKSDQSLSERKTNGMLFFGLLSTPFSEIIIQSLISSRMGACLISNTQKNKDKQNQVPPQSLRAEIKASLAEKTPPQLSIKYTEQAKVECEQTEEEVIPNSNLQMQQKKREEKNSLQSSSSLNVSDTGGQPTKRSIKQVIIPSSKELSNPSLFHERTQKQQTQVHYSEHPSEDEEQKASADLDEIETPFKRVATPNMRGLGVTEADNRLIEITVNVREPLRLNSVKFTNGSVYSGDWVGGKRQGQGTLIWADGSRYDGEWRQNCSWGFGRLTYCDKKIYQGQFVKNLREGKGCLVGGGEGSTYVGQWHNDHQEGKGIETWGKRQRYEGQWLAGWKSGYGELYFEDGSYYKGEFNGNQIHGYGRYCWNGSRVYEGKWEHNRMCGQGVLLWNNGMRQQGLFRNDKMHGAGVIVQPDGSTSRGVFESGRKNGIFTQIDSLGIPRQVEYHMGKRLKLGDSRHRHKQNLSSSSKTARSTTPSK